MKVHFGHTAPGEVVVGETGHALPGAFGKKLN
jgi:hypothetical protein